MPVIIEKKVPGKANCPHCWAEEGQLHRWGCEHDICPFCGTFGKACDCHVDMVEVAMRSAETVRPACMTAEHEKRWLELIGDSYLKRLDLLDSPFDEEDFYFECPPEWCDSDAQYKAYWKLQEKFMKMEDLLFGKWKVLCNEENRIPQIEVPNMCACCGALWPEMFSVPGEEWQRYVVPHFQRRMLCLDCYNRQKAIFPEGWSSALPEGQDQDNMDTARVEYLKEKGIFPVCRRCGAQVPAGLKVTVVEWEKYVPPLLQEKTLCAACLERMKVLFPRGWRKAKEPAPVKKPKARRKKWK